MNELGRLQDLPADYVAALRTQNLVPLWPSLRALLTPIEKAERRVLMLASPGHGLDAAT